MDTKIKLVPVLKAGKTIKDANRYFPSSARRSARRQSLDVAASTIVSNKLAFVMRFIYHKVKIEALDPSSSKSFKPNENPKNKRKRLRKILSCVYQTEQVFKCKYQITYSFATFIFETNI